MRILMRGATDPLVAMDPAKFIIENHTGGNIGNMIFTHSIAKALLVDDDVQIDYVNIVKQKTDRYYADYVNDTYDCFLIPLANAFKVKGHDEMTKLADFIKMLKIPCAIIGVGLQRTLGSDRFIDIYPHNDEVKALVNAVLEKSPIIGVRGEMTGDYLKDLGYKEEKDFTVIGCPSMYTFGDTLPEVKHIELNKDSVVSFNSKIEFEKLEGYKPFMEFTKKNMAEFPNMIYVQQQIDDVRMIYLDKYKQKLRKNKMYDISKAVSFVDIPSWIDYFKENVDFSVGSRIHGNVAAILGGVPALTIPFDRRVFELADYHNIPMVDCKTVNENVSLYDLFEKADFNSVHKGHKERFEHYLDFLHKLDLDTVYDHTYEGGITPYDRITSEQNYYGVIKAYDAADDAERLVRYRSAFPIVKKMQLDETKKVEKLQEQIKNLKAELAEAKAAEPQSKSFKDKLKSKLSK